MDFNAAQSFIWRQLGLYPDHRGSVYKRTRSAHSYRSKRRATVRAALLDEAGMGRRDATRSGDPAAQLCDRARMRRLRENVWQLRETFTFDAQADRLVAFVREVIAERG